MPFQVIANVHSQLNHQGINKVHNRILEGWYGITEANVRWVLRECAVCVRSAPQPVKVPPIPIISERCMDRVQIDLVDQRSKKDGDFCFSTTCGYTHSRTSVLRRSRSEYQGVLVTAAFLGSCEYLSRSKMELERLH